MDIQPDAAIPPVEVSLGTLDQVQPILGQGSRILVDRNELNEVTTELRLTDNVEAPVEQGQKLGEMVVSVGGQERQVIPLVADPGCGTSDPARNLCKVRETVIYGRISGIKTPAGT